MDQDRYVADKPEGPVSAAIIAAGVGSATLGVLTPSPRPVPP